MSTATRKNISSRVVVIKVTKWKDVLRAIAWYLEIQNG
jgi:hypothetical protein